MQFKSIIAAIDLDDDLAEGVVRAAQGLAEKDSAELKIVTVWPALSTGAPGFSPEIGAPSAVVTDALIEQHRDGRKDFENRLAALTSRLARSGAAVLLDGEAAEEIAEYARKIHADLIVTGSHQRKFWDSLFQGSPSLELIREAPCALFLVTKPFAATLK